MPTRIGLSPFSRRLASGAAMATVAAAVVLGTSGCGAGQVSQTANMLPGVNGAFGNLGEVQLRDVQVVYPPQDADKAFAAGGPYQLSFVISNGSDIETYRLTGIRAEQGTVALSSDVTIPAGKAVRVGRPALLLEPSGSAAPSGESSSAPEGSIAEGSSPEGSSAETSSPAASSSPSATAAASGGAATQLIAGTATLSNAGDTVAPGLLTNLTFSFAKVGENSIGNQLTPIGEVTIKTPVDTGTLQTRVDVPRQAEPPAGEEAAAEGE